ncbi:MAG TPA: pantetheine-phosphate adenylyltransferase, partial [Candidatus Dormibacteraeota bacterium]|nr:pantetheine-phosphate adenylyltransferase [Candidatus Dormibacteraeota bacterium]
DIIERASLMFDRVVVGVLANTSKEPMFTVEERIELLRVSIGEHPRVEVTSFDGLTVDFARHMDATAIVRGLRVLSDFESEFQMALMNRRLNPDVNTVFLMTSFSNVFVSSSIIKEVCRLGGNVDEAVPAISVAAIRRKFGMEGRARSANRRATS